MANYGSPIPAILTRKERLSGVRIRLFFNNQIQNSVYFMQQLIHLIEQLPAHEALKNKFYSRWVKTSLPIESIAVFALNYWEFSKQFPTTLAQLIVNTQDVSAQVEYTKILYSELGYGKTKKAHSVLFQNFCRDLAEKMGVPGSLSLEHLKIPLLAETIQLIEGEKNLYSQDVAIGAGAQLALECQAFNMLSMLYEGARNYADMWPSLSDFHESCEFFYIHIGSAEKDHREEALAAVENIIKSDPVLLKKAIYGFNEHLNLFANFWKAIGVEMDKFQNEK